MAAEQKIAQNYAIRLMPLSWCLMGVFGFGAPGILIARAICLYYYPELFVGDSPTISETASHPPQAIIFSAFYCAVVTCIMVSWPLNLLRNGWLITRWGQGRAGVLAALNISSAAIGIVAGLSLLSLSLFHLHGEHDIHIASSWSFYIAQTVSIMLDIGFVLCLKRPGGVDLRTRGTVALLIFLGSLIFLYLYVNKDSMPTDIRYAVQLVYVGTENLLCLLFLAYPGTWFLEMRRDLRLFSTLAIEADIAAQPLKA